ncbi:unnamed protein product [Boreogadus saida]
MAEATGSYIEDVDFEDLMFESDVRGYLYEPQYSDEKLKLLEEQEAASAAATAEAEDLPVADEEPARARAGADWWCLCSHCAPMDTEVESVCCKEFQRCRFLLDKISESDEDTVVCVVEHPNVWVASLRGMAVQDGATATVILEAMHPGRCLKERGHPGPRDQRVPHQGAPAGRCPKPCHGVQLLHHSGASLAAGRTGRGWRSRVAGGGNRAVGCCRA